MKKYILLLGLICILVFTGYNPKEKEIAHTQELEKPATASEATPQQVGFKYSVDEVKKRLSDPSSHYKGENASPEIKAGEWVTEPLKNDTEGKFGSYSYAINTNQKFVIIHTKKNKVGTMGVATYFSGELTDKTIEEAIRAAEIAASAMGIEGDDINKKIRELLVSQYGFEVCGEIMLRTDIRDAKFHHEKVLSFSIITDPKYDDL